MLLEQAVPVLTEEKIRSVLDQFVGDIQQIPPMYSALKKEGRPILFFVAAKENSPPAAT